jgi:hypothetical protein
VDEVFAASTIFGLDPTTQIECARASQDAAGVAGEGSEPARSPEVRLKNPRRDLDIQPEMKRSTPSGVSSDVESIASQSENSVVASDRDLSEDATGLPDPRATSSDAPIGEGSMGYRIAAMIAMLLLALAALGIWLFFRGN